MASTAALLPREVLKVGGRDALSFLDSQISQDLKSLGEGGAAASFLLQPDGKVVDLLGVHRIGDEVLIDVDRAARDLVEQRLRRFLFRVEVTIASSDLLVAWWPEGEPHGDTVSVRTFGKSGQLVLCHALGSDVQLLSDAEMHQERITREIPFFGAEITDRTIPAALGTGIVASAVSFTKGCYTGQELVARLDARGNQVPFHLVKVTADETFCVGDELDAQGEGPKGTVTSVALSRDRQSFIGLGFVHRSQIEVASVRLSNGGEARIQLLEGAGIF